jgi:hypothetical protein
MTDGRQALSQTIREEGEFLAQDENGEKEIHNYDGESFVIVDGDEEPTILMNEEEFKMDKEALSMIDQVEVSDNTVTIGTNETSMKHKLRDQEIDGWDKLDDTEAKKVLVSSELSTDEEIGG